MALPPPNVKTDTSDTFGDIKGSLLEIANDIRLQRQQRKYDEDQGLYKIDDILKEQLKFVQERNTVNNNRLDDKHSEIVDLHKAQMSTMHDIHKLNAEGMTMLAQQQISLLEEMHETIKSLQMKSDMQYANVIDHQDEMKMIANQQLLLDNQVLKLEDKREKKESRALVKREREQDRLESIAAFDQPMALPAPPSAKPLDESKLNLPKQEKPLALPGPEAKKKSGILNWVKSNAKGIAAGLVSGGLVASAFGYEYFKEIPDIRKRLEEDLKDGVITKERFDKENKKLDREERGSIGGMVGGVAGGALAGAATGAALGSVIPFFGTAIGAGIGGLVGAIGGALGGEAIGESDFVASFFGDDDPEEVEVDPKEKFANRVLVKFPKRVKQKLGLKKLMLGAYFVDPVVNKVGNYHLYPKQDSLSSMVVSDPKAKEYILAKLNDPNAKTVVEMEIEKEDAVKEFKVSESLAEQGFDVMQDEKLLREVTGGENYSRRVSKSTLIDPEDLKEEPGTIGKAIDSVKGFFGLETLAEKEERMKKELADKRLEVLDTSLKKEDDLLKAEKELAEFEATTKTAQKKVIRGKAKLITDEAGNVVGFESSVGETTEFADPALQKKQDELQKAVSEKKKDLIATNAAIVSADIVAATGGGAELDDDASVDNMFGEMTKAGIDIRAFIKAGPMTKEEAADYQTAITSKGGSYDLFLVNVKGYDEFGVPDGIYDLRRNAIKKAYEKFKTKQLASEKDARRDDLKAIASAGLDEDDDKKPQEGFFAFIKRKATNLKDMALQGLDRVKEDVTNMALDQARNVKNMLRTDTRDALDTMETDIAGEQQKMGLEDGFAPGQLRDVGSGAGISSSEGMMEGGPAAGYFQTQEFMEGGDASQVSSENVAAVKTKEPIQGGFETSVVGPGGVGGKEAATKILKRISVKENGSIRGGGSAVRNAMRNANNAYKQLLSSGDITQEEYDYIRRYGRGNAIFAFQKGGVSGLKDYAKKQLEKRAARLEQRKKDIAASGKSEQAFTDQKIQQAMTRNIIVDDDEPSGGSGFDYSVNAQSGEGLIEKKIAEGKASLRLEAAQKQNMNNQDQGSNIVAGNTTNNDNSTTNVNNTKTIVPVIAANNNNSYNNVGKGNMAFR